MDSITQALLGGAIGAAGFGKSLGGRAVVFGALLGIAPDLDMFGGNGDPWHTMLHHRGLTHGLPFLLAMAPVAGGLAWLLERRKHPFLTWTHLAAWAIVTHPLLDWFTTYGTQLLAPFSDSRFALDGVAVVDPAYSLILLIGLIVAGIKGWNSSGGRHAATAALVLSCMYLATGVVQSQRMIRRAETTLDEKGVPPLAELRATPMLLSLGAWHIVGRDEAGALYVANQSAWNPKPLRFVALPLPSDPLVRKAMESERGRQFRWFAQDMVAAEILRDESGDASVLLRDHRYGHPFGPEIGLFQVRFDFDPKGELVQAVRLRRRMKATVGEQIDALWRFIKTGDNPPPPTSDGGDEIPAR